LLRLARFDHSASLLPDGTVLVAGGTVVRSPSSNSSTTTAELYNPATGAWTPAAPMTDPRSGHCAVSLPDGRVLAVGGGRYVTLDNGVGQAYCELYDPVAGTWTPTATMASPRWLHQAVLLTDGDVLAIGGGDPQLGGESTVDPYALSTVERFSPSTQRWTPVASMPWARSRHQAALLRDGRVLIVGGTNQALAESGYQNAVVYDPLLDTWTPTGPMATPRYDLSLASVAGGVLVTCGVTTAAPAIPDYATNGITAATEFFLY